MTFCWTHHCLGLGTNTDLESAVLREADVVRLEVAVNDHIILQSRVVHVRHGRCQGGHVRAEDGDRHAAGAPQTPRLGKCLHLQAHRVPRCQKQWSGLESGPISRGGKSEVEKKQKQHRTC